MRIVADEGVDAAIVRLLRTDGHDVAYIAEVSPGLTDEEVLSRASNEGRLLLTADKDFGELVFRLGRVATGLVLIRLPGLSSERKAELVAHTLREHSGELEGAFTVVSPRMVRIRRGD